MPTTLIAGGRVLDPSQNLDRVTNVLLRDGKVAGFDVAVNGQDRVIDATGKIVTPGLIDMHVHLREPGREEAETIETGKPFPVSSADMLDVVGVFEAIIRSMAEERPISVTRV